MKNLLTALFLALVILACSNEEDEEIIDDVMEEPQGSELPTTYVIVKSDTFYLALKSVLPDPNVYRIQLNFATKNDLTEANNDGDIPSIFSIGISTKEKLTTSGELPYTDQRSAAAIDEKMNFYQSFFLNTGSEYGGDNFLSPSTGDFSYELTNGQLVGNIQVIMSNEIDPMKTIEIIGHLEFDY